VRNINFEEDVERQAMTEKRLQNDKQDEGNWMKKRGRKRRIRKKERQTYKGD